MGFAPIFIVGVPRSGTTLLRVLLDSHSRILALPETPWILGSYQVGEASLRGLLEEVSQGPYGAVGNVAGSSHEHVRLAGVSFLEHLFQPVLDARGKTVMAFKTPGDISYLDFLTDLLPEARYIHITRDGRDVAMSQIAKRGSFFHDLKDYRRLSYANVFKRWVEWEQRVRDTLYRDGLHVAYVRYEDLIADPERELKRIMAFLDLPFERGMLDYASQDHDYPAWEAGSMDVAGQGGISAASVGKWRTGKMSVEILHTLQRYDKFLVDLGYPSSNLRPGWRARAAMAGFPLVEPFLDAGCNLHRRWLHPVLNDGGRIFACLALLVLAFQFLVPSQPLKPFGLATDAYQPLLCFAVSLAFLMAAVPALIRRLKVSQTQTLLRVGAAMLAYMAILEWGQAFMPGRSAALRDFLFNASGVIVALIVSKFLLSKLHSWARPV